MTPKKKLAELKKKFKAGETLSKIGKDLELTYYVIRKELLEMELITPGQSLARGKEMFVPPKQEILKRLKQYKTVRGLAESYKRDTGMARKWLKHHGIPLPKAGRRRS